VFVSDRDGSDDLWVIDTQGGEAAHITSSPDADHFPAWSPDGSLILFSREAPTGSSLMALPTACLDQPATCEGLLRAITSERYDRYPAFAPGGGQLAFAAGTIAGEPTVIALMNVDGSNYSPLAGTGSSDFGPAWSPDGLRIAFVSYALGDQDLWVMSFTGRDLVQITSGAATDVGPSWSPDGSLIVFASDRGEGGSFDLYAMRADCSTPGEGCEENALHLTDDPADELDPAWTP
jgi:Tol biopolymer transport system component